MIIMAKYYVQSGSVRAVVDSVDVERAALWAVNEVMDRALSLNDDDGAESDVQVVQSMSPSHLGATIQISEVGFDREDLVVDTLQVFKHWYELFQAVSILSNTLDSTRR
jgi:hypothetical protein